MLQVSPLFWKLEVCWCHKLISLINKSIDLFQGRPP